ncbi:DNA (cytosine-5-)-methyltransferase [Mycoplasma seminis]|uniref:DNA (cytosine-5-)-methyltransferase n=1 Tax=Mycoplasma seminis TaxID=512749 RepID=A0ABY9H981_9MOLU|nr:DNA (cytosine-5-)-methyltransferase [Mycoplasma seminis]WLP85144.1 DNA (cytosine-5-)-methyltransferase [Mycoplasma seminis]
MNEDKLSLIFPYLYSYVNNEYSNKHYKNHTKLETFTSSTDITQFSRLPENIDIFTYSFPCQDLSQQGKQRGIKIGTRSGLLYEVERILKENIDRLPKVLLLENVKALNTSKFKEPFNNWLNTLSDLGYKSYFKVLNSADYGSAQNRERVFAVSILETHLSKDFEFPKPEKSRKTLEKIIKLNIDDKYSNLMSKYKITNFTTTKNNITKARLIGYTKFNSESYIYKPVNSGPTLTASGANSRLKFYFEKENKLKFISSLESFLYMGFDKKDHNIVKNSGLISETKMIYTCGNSISVEVLEAIFKEILKCLK